MVNLPKENYWMPETLPSLKTIFISGYTNQTCCPTEHRVTIRDE